jgi:NAD(P)-dependent dehydrogenase (short-subunit alcohol dehydrogenase family)
MKRSTLRPLALIALALTAFAVPGRAVAQDTPEDRPLAGQEVVLITGSTSGLGREVAYRVAGMGAHVIVHGRDVERGNEVVARIRAEGGTASFVRADLASLDQVRQLAATVLEDYDRIDILINNAGIGSRVPAARSLSEDGYELRFAVNYLSHFLLTDLLLPRIRQSAPARIINVSSIGQAPIDFDDVMIEQNYSGSRAYGQSKLSQIMFTIDLAADLEGTGISVFSLHPATYMDTNMVRSGGITPRTTVDEGADAVMQLVTAPDLESGQFFNGLRPGRANAQAYDPEARARLRALSRELTGGR